MRYLIIYADKVSFMTDWYDYDNNYSEGMSVYDFGKLQYTTNGIDWIELFEDHL